jgi:GT2 family glycosyltransferase
MKLAVVMPTINAHDGIKLAVESLRFSVGKNATLYMPSGGGFSRNVNDGIRDARRVEPDLDGILVCNDDIVCLSRNLDQRIETAIQHSRSERIAAVGFTSNYVMGHQRASVVVHDTIPPVLEEVPFLSFFCIYLSCRAIDDVGLLDENFGIGQWEDNDWCYRAKQKHWKLLLDKSIFIWHWGSLSLSTKPEAEEMYRKNKELFCAKHGITT